MRIVSLVPHATELLFALGLGDEVIGVTHECDHPPAARGLPHITRDALPAGLSAAEIDAAVRARTQAGGSIYELDTDLLTRLAPDLIVTQALCPVCAVSYDDVAEVARTMPGPPRVIALDPHTLGETLGDVRTIAQATGRREEGVTFVQETAARVDRVRLAMRGSLRPRVVFLEWMDPVYIAGHWTPQLIDYAGGTDACGLAGEPSERSTWEAVAATEPEVVIVGLCGFDAERNRLEALDHAHELVALGEVRVVAIDAGAYFSRPGPRLVEGLELLAHVLHPDRVPDPGTGGAIDVALTVGTPR